MLKTNKYKLPQIADVREDNEWIPIPRQSGFIPFGYEVDENDDTLLIPITSDLDLLEEARKHVKRYSYKEVADWLSANSGKRISKVGLYKRLKYEGRYKREAGIIERWAKETEELYKKAEKLRAERVGAKRAEYSRAGFVNGDGI